MATVASACVAAEDQQASSSERCPFGAAVPAGLVAHMGLVAHVAAAAAAAAHSRSWRRVYSWQATADCLPVELLRPPGRLQAGLRHPAWSPAPAPRRDCRRDRLRPQCWAAPPSAKERQVLQVLLGRQGSKISLQSLAALAANATAGVAKNHVWHGPVLGRCSSDCSTVTCTCPPLPPSP